MSRVLTALAVVTAMPPVPVLSRPPVDKLADDAIGPNHPIHDVETWLFGNPGGATRDRDRALSQPVVRLTARLLKDRVAVGEPLWAALRLQNLSADVTYRLSPPYLGVEVATAAAWRARRDPLAGRDWGELRASVPLNKEYLRYEMWPPREKAWYPGVPVIVKPGEALETIVPLNAAQQVSHPEKLGDHWWFAGIGLSEPGWYRLYVQYSNLGDPVLPKGRSTKAAQSFQARPVPAEGEPQDLPFTALVSGPIDVEVVLPRSTNPDRLVKLIRQWELAALVRSDGVGVPNVDGVDTVLADLDPAETAVRDSLRLTVLRRRVSQLDGAPHAHELLHPLLEQCVNARREVPDGPMADAYDLTTCHIMRALGREQEAVGLARKLNTADAAAFVAASQDAIDAR